jgi:CRP-like cAMP-binding protein/membrane protein YdbS with pleckstrin-like domain
MTTKAQFLGQLEIFAQLEDDELEDLAALTDEYEFDEGAIIAYQRDVANLFYIVREGRLFSQRIDQRGIVREAKAYDVGGYFNDAWLFTPGIHPASIKASSDGRLLVITEPNFLKFLEKHPQALPYLNLSEEAQEESTRSRAALSQKQYQVMGLMPDELVELESRRTNWMLPFHLGPPATGMAVATFVFVIALNMLESVPDNFHSLLLLLPTLLFLGFFLWAIVRWYDWYNDFFVITNSHIIHYEYELLTFNTSLSKTPIDRIQSVEVAKPDFWATLFNVGTVRVTTAAQEAVIFFDYVKNPEGIREKLSELRQRVQKLDEGRIQAELREVVEGHFQKPVGFRKYEPPPPPDLEELLDDDEPEGSVLGDMFRSVFSSLQKPKWRRHSKPVVVENVVDYGKHWIVMFMSTARPTAVNLLLVGAMLGLYYFNAPIILYFPLGLILIGTALWWLWRFEDWRNDRFQVTDRYVIDINRRPFGFGESRRQAELGNVQNVNAYRTGFLQWLFNYGTVYIETAGATSDITFNYVKNPNQVQDIVFARRDAFRRRQQAAEGVGRRREYAVMLDVFHQAQEQGLIPQRTPLTEDEDVIRNS